LVQTPRIEAGKLEGKDLSRITGGPAINPFC
jgi:hypothetical protein